jgi:hypothetical protein
MGNGAYRHDPIPFPLHSTDLCVPDIRALTLHMPLAGDLASMRTDCMPYYATRP